MVNALLRYAEPGKLVGKKCNQSLIWVAINGFNFKQIQIALENIGY